MRHRCVDAGCASSVTVYRLVMDIPTSDAASRTKMLARSLSAYARVESAFVTRAHIFELLGKGETPSQQPFTEHLKSKKWTGSHE